MQQNSLLYLTRSTLHTVGNHRWTSQCCRNSEATSTSWFPSPSQSPKPNRSLQKIHSTIHPQKETLKANATYLAYPLPATQLRHPTKTHTHTKYSSGFRSCVHTYFITNLVQHFLSILTDTCSVFS